MGSGPGGSRTRNLVAQQQRLSCSCFWRDSNPESLVCRRPCRVLVGAARRRSQDKIGLRCSTLGLSCRVMNQPDCFGQKPATVFGPRPATAQRGCRRQESESNPRHFPFVSFSLEPHLDCDQRNREWNSLRVQKNRTNHSQVKTKPTRSQSARVASLGIPFNDSEYCQ